MFRLLCDEHLCAIIARVTVGKYRHQLGLCYGQSMIGDESGSKLSDH